MVWWRFERGLMAFREGFGEFEGLVVIGCEGVTIRTKDRVFFVWRIGDDEGGGCFEWENGMGMDFV